MQSRNILCIDNEETCHLYKMMFARLNRRVKVLCAANLEQAIDFVESKTIDLYILEPFNNGIDGLELCRLIRKSDMQTPILVYSGMSRDKDRLQALAAGADAYLVKAAEIDRFIETVKGFLN